MRNRGHNEEPSGIKGLGLRAGRQEDNERHLLRRPASIRDGAFWIQRPSTSGTREALDAKADYGYLSAPKPSRSFWKAVGTRPLRR